MATLLKYKNFLQGIGILPKSSSENTLKGEIEVLTTNNKLYFHNGTINDPIVQENVTATLANKTLTAPVINNATADTITGIAGGALLVQSASNQNLSLQAQGTGVVLLEGLNFNGNVIKNNASPGDITINADGGSTFLQTSGVSRIKVTDNGIEFLSASGVTRDARFYNGGNTDYISIKAASAFTTSGYNIVLPDASPNPNTALIYDGTNYKWGAAGGADAAGANDDILATSFRARILDSFDDSPTLSSSTVNNTSTTSTYSAVSQLYPINYANFTVSSGSGTSYVISGTPAYTPKNANFAGDVAVVVTSLGTEVRGIVSLIGTSLTIDGAFNGTVTVGANCIISQVVVTKELYNSQFDGTSIAYSFSNASFSEYLIDYQDSTSTTFPPNFNTGPQTALVGYSVSNNATPTATSWSNVTVRPTLQTDQIASGIFASPSTYLYARFFANTTGSGVVNLLEYRAYMQKSPVVASGVLNQAYALLNNTGSKQGIQSITTVAGKTQVVLNWEYTIGQNPSLAYGSLDVYINGQIIPRFIDVTTTAGAYYTETNSSTITLDTNYSATAYAIQIIQRQPVGNFAGTGGLGASSGGSGLKNYLTTYKGNPGNGDFESGLLTGTWQYVNGVTIDATTKVPTGGSFSDSLPGGVVNSLITSNTLAASYSLSTAMTTAASIQGKGFCSYPFTIDNEDKNKVLGFKFAYQLVSDSAAGTANAFNASGSSTNTLAVYIYDVSAGSWIQPAGVYSIVQSSGAGYASGTFQTSATSSQYRIVILNINTYLTNCTVAFDDFFVGPQVSVNAPVISDWVNYTPSSAIPGFGTCSSLNFKSRRIGDSLEVVASFVSGTPSGAIQIPLGFNGGVSNVTVDTTKIPAGSIVGKAAQSGFSATYFSLSVLAPATNQSYVNVGIQTSTAGETVAITANTISVSTTIELFFTVPIVGWSSNSIASNDTDTRVVAASLSNGTSTVALSGTTAVLCPFSTVVDDTHGAWSTSSNTYTIPVSGRYKITFQPLFNVTAIVAGCQVNSYIYIDGAQTAAARTPIIATATFLSNTCVFENNFKAGQVVSFYAAFATAGANAAVFYNDPQYSKAFIERLSGPAVITATESVYASYYINSGTFAASPTVPINFNTAEFDSHNAVTTSLTAWKFTAPISGAYEVSTYVYGQNPGTSVTFYLYKNQPSVGTSTKVITFQQSGTNSSGSCLIKLNAGDFVDMRPDVSRNITGGALNTANCSYIQIKRIGN